MNGFRKAINTRPTIIYHYVTENDNQWNLDGVSKSAGISYGLDKLGASWVRGKPGMWELTEELAKRIIAQGIRWTENINGKITEH